mmetsp:Transcript_57139/g.185719  ORF Transcript_57139/g.185719 Transcript_57139/m.185719 type:complete len:243 (+) Transcript_57139:948-1676(+)
MHDAAQRKVLHSAEHLFHNRARDALGHAIFGDGDALEEVAAVADLQDEVNRQVILVRLVKSHDVRMVEAPQNVHLPANEAANVLHVLLQALLRDRLHRAARPRAPVRGADDFSVGATTKRRVIKDIVVGDQGSGRCSSASEEASQGHQRARLIEWRRRARGRLRGQRMLAGRDPAEEAVVQADRTVHAVHVHFLLGPTAKLLLATGLVARTTTVAWSTARTTAPEVVHHGAYPKRRARAHFG